MIPCEAYYLSLACHNAALLNVKLGRWADAQELVDEGIEFTKAPAIVVPRLACNKTHITNITNITDITYYHHSADNLQRPLSTAAAAAVLKRSHIIIIKS